jgi:hypothetical protein
VEQPVIQPDVETTTPAPVAEAPDTTPQQDAPSTEAAPAPEKKPRARRTKPKDAE